MKHSFGFAPQLDQCSCEFSNIGFNLTQHQRFEVSLDYFVEMRGDSVHEGDSVLYEYFSAIITLSACSGFKDLQMGTQIHGLASNLEF